MELQDYWNTVCHLPHDFSITRRSPYLNCLLYENFNTVYCQWEKTNKQTNPEKTQNTTIWGVWVVKIAIIWKCERILLDLSELQP